MLGVCSLGLLCADVQLGHQCTWDGFVKSKPVANNKYTCLMFRIFFVSLHFDLLGTTIAIFSGHIPQRVWNSVAHKLSPALGVMEETLGCWPAGCSVEAGGTFPFISPSPGPKLQPL